MIEPENGRPRAVLCGTRLAGPEWHEPSRLIEDLVRLLQDAEWQVVIVTSGPTRNVREVTLLRREGVAVFPDGDGVLGELLTAAPFELAIFIGMEAAAHYLPVVRRLAPTAPLVVTLLPPGTGSTHLSPLNLGMLATADAVMVTSDGAAQAARDLVPADSVHFLPDLGVLGANPRAFHERRGMLVAGMPLGTWPAVLEALPPPIRAEHPIYVAAPEFTGVIPSLLPYLEATRVVALPESGRPAGAGVAIHALMLGTPVVTTSTVARTLGLVAGSEVVAEDDPGRRAARITELLTDEPRWTDCADTGRNGIVRRHGRQLAQRAFGDLLDAVAGKVKDR